MERNLKTYTIWRWKLNGNWSIEARKLLFANIALVFSYTPEDLDLVESEESMIGLSINHLVESLCLKNGFANPYEREFYRFEYCKKAMELSNDEYFDWKWPYALNKMILTRGEDDLSRYLYDQLIKAMKGNGLSLSYYYGYFCSDNDTEEYGGYGLLTLTECEERPIKRGKRIDIKPQGDSLYISEVQTVSKREFFENVTDDAEACLDKIELKYYIKEIRMTEIEHRDINLIKEGIDTRLIVIKDFSMRVPADADNTEMSVYKKSSDGRLEWKMEFLPLGSEENDSANILATSEILRQIPDYDEEIAHDYWIGNDDLSNLLLGRQTMEENVYYICHSFPKFGTGKIDILLSDAMAFDSTIARCYRGIITLHSGENKIYYIVHFDGEWITRSVDVIDLFGEMLRSIRLNDEQKTAFQKDKARTVRYSSCAFNFAMDIPETNFGTVLNIEDGKDIG